MQLKLILYVIGFSAFAGSLGQNLYTPLLADMQKSLHTSSYMMSLTVSMFLVALAVMQVIFGSLADSKGRKKILIPALIVYAAASLGCAFSHSIGLFLLFRIFQGIGSAAIPVVGAAIIGDLFRGQELAKGMATYQLMLLLAPAVGPLLGGMIGERFGYEGVFLFLTAIVLLLLAANMKLLVETRPQKAVPSTFALRSFSAILRNRLSAVVLLYGFAQSVVYLIYIVFLPQVLASLYRLPAGRIGIILLAMSASTIASIRIGSWMRNRFGSRISFVSAFLLQSVTVILFALTAQLSLPALISDVCLFGSAMGLTVSLPVTILAEQFPEERATAMGVYNLVRYLGMALGPVIGAALYSDRTLAPLFLTSGFVFLVIVLAGGAWIGGKRDRGLAAQRM
ncbi:MFS transporter [Paenibacillus sacheonensis]|uniref:MFS transporter n=1 Tax=Paenibacillus sacheonensis TaxID=742054 RepID=A0A7X5C1S6_9BACL|nr:MFS transporter [Paenibacillus sacheonensis]MBM7566406.1 MFS family permease [Paenibacillus sacheonensis]NBC70605.1 MFS transporter [Paenibacillus sacheonensis]